ncbi:hypothetical protein AAFC00_002313 [Neodothiora populina]
MVQDVSHVVLAFMQSETFNVINQDNWPLFTNVEATRQAFAEGTKIMIAIGGWGDTTGFEKAATNEKTRAIFAANVKAMIAATGADGVDIDWEYPGGNGEDYKKLPNTEKAWEIDAYVGLLATLREELGSHILISAAVPGLVRDMIAFTEANVPRIALYVDFLNIMTYDLMNRRDNITKHHAGITASLQAIDAYLSRGLPSRKANLGFAFYIKWFKTDPAAQCQMSPIGCHTALLEDPRTGADLGRAGAFSWHDEVPADLSTSFQRAMKDGKYDNEGGGRYFWDSEKNIFWSWETPESISAKYDEVAVKKDLGGTFAWGLGEDAPHWAHFRALASKVEKSYGRHEEPPVEKIWTSALPEKDSRSHKMPDKDEL